MNARDRENIGGLLNCIAAQDYSAQINYALKIMEDHPKIIDGLESPEWWGLERKEEKGDQ